MLTLAKWSAERKKLKKAGKKETPKKKEKEDKQQEKKRKREEAVKKKQAEEISKVENFIDENIHEAFDTLSIYQKCLEDERRKWIKARKSMTANNAATAAKSLRRIYEITRQNMVGWDVLGCILYVYSVLDCRLVLYCCELDELCI